MENKPPINAEYVLDSFALLAYLEDEEGSNIVGNLLEQATQDHCRIFLCVVNLGEVIYIVERERGLPKAQETLARINELPINVINVELSLTLEAAHLKAECPIAYADCFAAALSKTKNVALVTGDPEFRKIDAEYNLKIEWLPIRKS